MRGISEEISVNNKKKNEEIDIPYIFQFLIVASALYNCILISTNFLNTPNIQNN